MREAALVAVGGLCGCTVRNLEDEDVGSLAELMVDTATGRITYAVLAYGGLLGVGEKLFAVPWEVLRIDPLSGEVRLDVSRDRLDEDPGFDKDAWPTAAEPHWRRLTQKI